MYTFIVALFWLARLIPLNTLFRLDLLRHFVSFFVGFELRSTDRFDVEGWMRMYYDSFSFASIKIWSKLLLWAHDFSSSSKFAKESWDQQSLCFGPSFSSWFWCLWLLDSCPLQRAFFHGLSFRILPGKVPHLMMIMMGPRTSRNQAIWCGHDVPHPVWRSKLSYLSEAWTCLNMLEAQGSGWADGTDNFCGCWSWGWDL